VVDVVVGGVQVTAPLTFSAIKRCRSIRIV